MDIIDKIIKKSNVKDQRTEEWLNYRKRRIGGSEMHFIERLNPNNIKTFINDFIYNKIDRKKFYIFACQFGILLENEIQEFSQVYHKCIIRNTGVLQNEIIPHVCYSPDGLSLIDNKVILFEFKCPYSRIPNGFIPANYLSQLNTGLNTIRECESAYYCECEFKFCVFDDLFNYDKYNTSIHTIKKERNMGNLYESYGIICLYADTDKNNINNDNDFCIGDKAIFDSKVLKNIYNSKYKTCYFNELNISNLKHDNNLPYHDKKKLPTRQLISDIKDLFNKHISEKKCFVKGYIYWKLYNYNTILKEKDYSYFDSNMIKKILHVGNLLNIIDNDNKEVDECIEYVKKYIK
jgi:hypothetical protein